MGQAYIQSSYLRFRQSVEDEKKNIKKESYNDGGSFMISTVKEFLNADEKTYNTMVSYTGHMKPL